MHLAPRRHPVLHGTTEQYEAPLHRRNERDGKRFSRVGHQYRILER